MSSLLSLLTTEQLHELGIDFLNLTVEFTVRFVSGRIPFIAESKPMMSKKALEELSKVLRFHQVSAVDATVRFEYSKDHGSVCTTDDDVPSSTLIQMQVDLQPALVTCLKLLDVSLTSQRRVDELDAFLTKHFSGLLRRGLESGWSWAMAMPWRVHCIEHDGNKPQDMNAPEAGALPELVMTVVHPANSLFAPMHSRIVELAAAARLPHIKQSIIDSVLISRAGFPEA